MQSRILSLIVLLPLVAACGGAADHHDCNADVEALNRLCDAFNSGSGPLQFVISEDYGPANVHGEISAEGSGAGEELFISGHLTIDIDPQSDEIYLSGIHIDLSDFVKGVGWGATGSPVLVEQINISGSVQDEDGNPYDPRSDPFSSSGELTCHGPLRINNKVTYSAYYFTTTFDEIVTPLTPPILTAGTLPDAVTIHFVGTVTLFYYAEVAMQYVSGAITYGLDFHAGY